MSEMGHRWKHGSEDGFAFVPTAVDSPAAQRCLDAYFGELAAAFESGFDPSRSVSADLAETTPPVGQFLVLVRDQLPWGCGGLKTLAPGIGEVKRMWLHQEVRGRGLGRALLVELEGWARRFGMDRLRLDTARQLDPAIGLYQSAGYRDIAPYNDNPYAHRWFEKRLG